MGTRVDSVFKFPALRKQQSASLLHDRKTVKVEAKVKHIVAVILYIFDTAAVMGDVRK